MKLFEFIDETLSTDRVNFLQLRNKLNGEMTSSNGLRVMARILVKIQYRGIQDVCIPAVKIGEPCWKKFLTPQSS